MNTEYFNVVRDAVVKKAFVSGSEQYIESGRGNGDAWLFDFRRILLRPEILDAYTEIFFEKYKDVYPFQVCGLEVAAIPLVSAIVMKSVQKNMPVNGFFIRKSRKKMGLLNMIEGQVNNEKIILVDDLINTGGSFIRQVEVLEQLKTEHGQGGPMHSVFPVLRFRDFSYYKYFFEKKILVESLFELNDFKNLLPVANLVDKTETPIPNVFNSRWYWKGVSPNYQHVVPKSAPVFYNGKLYFGTDAGTFMCLDAYTGKEVWKYQIFHGDKNKMQYSTPYICGGSVYFGGRDGNLYALDAETGKRNWVFLDADWIESSPCVAEEMGTLFINLEFGIFKKSGALVAIDTKTGQKKWESSHEGLTKSSPVYSKKFDMVFCGSENKMMYALDAKTGNEVWKLETKQGMVSAAYVDEAHNALVFGGMRSDTEEDTMSTIYVCDLKTGAVRVTYSGLEFGIYSTPLVYGDVVIVTALDKCIHAFDIRTGRSQWKVDTGSRIFASPVIMCGGTSRLYVGANNAILYEINPLTGEITGMTYVTERITNRIAFDEKTNRIFLPTYANEIYALEKKQSLHK